MQKPELHFPRRFFWGAAVSSHQVEGGNHNNWSVWELENAKSLAKSASYKLSHMTVWPHIEKQATDPDNYISGQAIDHYNRYKVDIAIAAKLNLNAFRFSIEWSRIEPEEGVWDIKAIEHYRDYIQEIIKNGMEPMMTLYHWTVPVWFVKKGGFEKSGNIEYFIRFAEKVIDEYYKDIRYITSINEPDTVMSHGYITLDHPPQKRSALKALLVYRNLLKSHKRIYRYAHKKSRRLRVGFTKSYAYAYAGNDSLLSRLSSRLDARIRDDLPIRYVRRQLDFIGMNYYFSDRYIGAKIENPNEKVNDLGWDMQPDNIYHVLMRLKKWRKPILITESGVADYNDQYRQWWITQSIMGMHKAIKKNVDLIGYMHWSLFDNFEWAYGKWPRFGLVAVDYENNMKRTVRPSGIWYGRIVKKLRGDS